MYANNIYMPIIIQQDATIYSLFISVTALHVSGGISTHHQELTSLYLQHLALLRPLLLPVVAVTASTTPDTVDTGIWASNDGRRYHPKHVEQLADINKLHIVASCWTIIDTNYAMHGPYNIKNKSEIVV